MKLQLRELSKSFNGHLVLDRVSLNLEKVHTLVLIGPSGGGKTTLLRIIAGLDQTDGGQVLVHGQDLTQQAVRDRRVGFVFQHYSLFKNMSVFENVAFGLRVRPRHERPSDAEIKRRVNELLGLVQLDPFAQRYPTQLSGGQRQRVALARALAIEPRMLLLDEPFGALDAKVRKELRIWLRHIHDKAGVTTVFVTHDQEEAFAVADLVAVMNQGRIEQMGTPQDVRRDPRTKFVSEFLAV